MADFTARFAFSLSFFASLLVFFSFLLEYFKFRKRTSLLKVLSFGLFLASSAIALFQGSPNSLSLPLAALGMVALYSSLVTDRHSQLGLSLPLPFIALFVFKEHELLFVLALLDLIAIIELANHEKHKSLLPFISAFTLIVVAQFFRIYGSVFNVGLMGVHTLYIITSFIFVLWILFRLISKMVKG